MGSQDKENCLGKKAEEKDYVYNTSKECLNSLPKIYHPASVFMYVHCTQCMYSKGTKQFLSIC